MGLTRRQALAQAMALTAGAVTLTTLGVGPASAGVAEAQARIAEFTGGRQPESGRITLTVPDIVENGSSVPVSVSVSSAMTGDDMVEAVLIVAEENPSPPVATLHFTSLSGAAAASLRMRLARTQDVVAVARMTDGSVYLDRRHVRVTVGGCAG
ncbi:MAG: thiosulfate oxidation carrier protein SoxY [Alphaproteobacteria bacterium]|nr:MAG: thiosulfate oxidation carrier protein SoxY [Alphaproteobacteria bacterium]